MHLFPKLHRLAQTLYIKQSAQIGTYDAECVLKLLHSNDQELTLDNPVEIRRQSALKKLRNLNLSPKRTVALLRLAERLVLRTVTGADNSK